MAAQGVQSSTTDAHHVDRHSTFWSSSTACGCSTDPVCLAAGDAPAQSGPVNWDALRDVDAVAVSHAHYDHLDPASLRRLGRSVPLIVPRGAARMVRGFERVWRSRKAKRRVGALAIRATHAQHSGHRDFLGSPAAAVGFLISGSSRLYFPGDTDLFPSMSSLALDLDVAFLPVAGWGSRVPRGHSTRLAPWRRSACCDLVWRSRFTGARTA